MIIIILWQPSPSPQISKESSFIFFKTNVLDVGGLSCFSSMPQKVKVGSTSRTFTTRSSSRWTTRRSKPAKSRPCCPSTKESWMVGHNFLSEPIPPRLTSRKCSYCSHCSCLISISCSGFLLFQASLGAQSSPQSHYS